MRPGGSHPVEAVVQVGELSTPYLRCGRGPSLVLVVLDARARRELVAELAPGHCVIAPVPPEATSPLQVPRLAGWLRDVLDGLGLQPAEIVLGPDAAALAAPLSAAGEVRVRILQPSCVPGARSLDGRS